jgi:hypothetical protein
MIGHVAGTRAKIGLAIGRADLNHMPSGLGFVVVGRTGFEPVTSSVSGMPIPSDTVARHRVITARRGAPSRRVAL